jgi:hypothetical protein
MRKRERVRQIQRETHRGERKGGNRERGLRKTDRYIYIILSERDR